MRARSPPPLVVRARLLFQRRRVSTQPLAPLPAVRAPTTSASSTPSPARARCTSPLSPWRSSATSPWMVGWHARLLRRALAAGDDQPRQPPGDGRERRVRRRQPGDALRLLPPGGAALLGRRPRPLLARAARAHGSTGPRRALPPPGGPRRTTSPSSSSWSSSNLAVVYFFNVINKSGEVWRKGETIHYVLWLNRMVTGVAVFFRKILPMWTTRGLTWSVLGVEGLPGPVDPLALRPAPHPHAGHPGHLDPAHRASASAVPARALLVVPHRLVLRPLRARAVGSSRLRRPLPPAGPSPHRGVRPRLAPRLHPRPPALCA